jgi:hypothetical protein
MQNIAEIVDGDEEHVRPRRDRSVQTLCEKRQEEENSRSHGMRTPRQRV